MPLLRTRECMTFVFCAATLWQVLLRRGPASRCGGRQHHILTISDQTRYQPYSAVLACYAAERGHTYSVERAIEAASVMFRRHYQARLRLQRLEEGTWMLVLDADVALVSKRPCLHQYTAMADAPKYNPLGLHVDAIMFERTTTSEIHAYAFFVRRSPGGLAFLTAWAELENVTRGFERRGWCLHNNDNGALHLLLTRERRQAACRVLYQEAAAGEEARRPQQSSCASLHNLSRGAMLQSCAYYDAFVACSRLSWRARLFRLQCGARVLVLPAEVSPVEDFVPGQWRRRPRSFLLHGLKQPSLLYTNKTAIVCGKPIPLTASAISGTLLQGEQGGAPPSCPVPRAMPVARAIGAVQPRPRVHDPEARNCTGVYFDFGTNIGIQVRKLFEPWRFPNAPVHNVFDRHFPERKSVCVLGLEPNPQHTPRLQALQQRLAQLGHTFNFSAAAAGTEDDEAEFHISADPRDEAIGVRTAVAARLSQGQLDGQGPPATTVRVPVVSVAGLIKGMLPAHRVPVVMKMDIEGAEMLVLPWLAANGLLCDSVDELILEVHPRLGRQDDVPDSPFRRALALLSHTPHCRTRVSLLDDETYMVGTLP